MKEFQKIQKEEPNDRIYILSLQMRFINVSSYLLSQGGESEQMKLCEISNDEEQLQWSQQEFIQGEFLTI